MEHVVNIIIAIGIVLFIRAKSKKNKQKLTPSQNSSLPKQQSWGTTPTVKEIAHLSIKIESISIGYEHEILIGLDKIHNQLSAQDAQLCAQEVTVPFFNIICDELTPPAILRAYDRLIAISPAFKFADQNGYRKDFAATLLNSGYQTYEKSDEEGSPSESTTLLAWHLLHFLHTEHPLVAAMKQHDPDDLIDIIVMVMGEVSPGWEVHTNNVINIIQQAEATLASQTTNKEDLAALTATNATAQDLWAKYLSRTVTEVQKKAPGTSPLYRATQDVYIAFGAYLEQLRDDKRWEYTKETKPDAISAPMKTKPEAKAMTPPLTSLAADAASQWFPKSQPAPSTSQPAHDPLEEKAKITNKAANHSYQDTHLQDETSIPESQQPLALKQSSLSSPHSSNSIKSAPIAARLPFDFPPAEISAQTTPLKAPVHNNVLRADTEKIQPSPAYVAPAHPSYTLSPRQRVSGHKPMDHKPIAVISTYKSDRHQENNK